MPPQTFISFRPIAAAIVPFMTYDLIIGDRSFSSWSLRGWLMFEKFGIPCRTKLAGLYSGTLADDLAAFAPAHLVPAMRTPDGLVVGDTMAMAETLAERHPEAGLWPAGAEARAFARWISAEMHSGFAALRGECPMYLRHAWRGFPVSQGVRDDLARIEYLWSEAARRFGRADSPWLFGDYSLADVFYAPVATRMATYQLPLGATTQAYVHAHLEDDAFRRWRALGNTVRYDPMPYQRALEPSPWPGPTPRSATAEKNGPSENARCPYSGKPTTHFLGIDGRVIGFCNAQCRDKTLQDPDAWPEVRALLEGRVNQE